MLLLSIWMILPNHRILLHYTTRVKWIAVGWVGLLCKGTMLWATATKVQPAFMCNGAVFFSSLIAHMCMFCALCCGPVPYNSLPCWTQVTLQHIALAIVFCDSRYVAQLNSLFSIWCGSCIRCMWWLLWGAVHITFCSNLYTSPYW